MYMYSFIPCDVEEMIVSRLFRATNRAWCLHNVKKKHFLFLRALDNNLFPLQNRSQPSARVLPSNWKSSYSSIARLLGASRNFQRSPRRASVCSQLHVRTARLQLIRCSDSREPRHHGYQAGEVSHLLRQETPREPPALLLSQATVTAQLVSASWGRIISAESDADATQLDGQDTAHDPRAGRRWIPPEGRGVLWRHEGVQVRVRFPLFFKELWGLDVFSRTRLFRMKPSLHWQLQLMRSELVKIGILFLAFKNNVLNACTE